MKWLAKPWGLMNSCEQRSASTRACLTSSGIAKPNTEKMSLVLVVEPLCILAWPIALDEWSPTRKLPAAAPSAFAITAWTNPHFSGTVHYGETGGNSLLLREFLRHHYCCLIRIAVIAPAPSRFLKTVFPIKSDRAHIRLPHLQK